MPGEDDDLDAFFDDVQQVEAKAVQEEEKPEQARKSAKEEEEEEEEEEVRPPPAKKTKITAAPRRRVVVAASAASVSAPAPDTTTTTTSAASTTTLPPAPPQPSAPVGPVLPPGVVPPPPPPPPSQQPRKPHIRTAAGKTWVDESLADWPDNDFRLFCGNLGNEVTDGMLRDHFQPKFASCQRAAVIRDAKTGNPKGYGFVSLTSALDCAAAIRQMDQTWLGSRPIRVRRSAWKDREKSKKKKKKHNKKGAK